MVRSLLQPAILSYLEAEQAWSDPCCSRLSYLILEPIRHGPILVVAKYPTLLGGQVDAARFLLQLTILSYLGVNQTWSNSCCNQLSYLILRLSRDSVILVLVDYPNLSWGRVGAVQLLLQPSNTYYLGIRQTWSDSWCSQICQLILGPSRHCPVPVVGNYPILS